MRVRSGHPKALQQLFVDLDGTFTGEQPMSSVLDSTLIADKAAFPDPISLCNL